MTISVLVGPSERVAFVTEQTVLSPIVPDTAADVRAIIQAAAAVERVALAQDSSAEQRCRAGKTLGILLNLLVGFNPTIEIDFSAERNGIGNRITMIFGQHAGACFTVPLYVLDHSARARVADSLGRPELHPGCLFSGQRMT